MNYAQNKDALINLAKDNQINLVKLYKQRLDEWLEAKKKLVWLARNNLIKFDKTNETAINEVLQSAADAGAFDSVYVGFEDETYIINTHFDVPAGYEPTKREWYKSALGKDYSIITLPYEDAFLKGHIRISTIASYKNIQGLQAVVAADLTLDQTIHEIANINENLQGFAFLMSKNGKLIASHEDCTECENAINAVQNSQKNFTMNGQNFSLFFERLDSSDWFFAVALDEGEILKELNESLKLNIIFALLTALFGVVGSYLTLRAFKNAKINEQIILSHSRLVAMGEMLVATTHQLKQPLSALKLNIEMAQVELQNENFKSTNELLTKSANVVNFMQSSLDSFKNFYRPQCELKKTDLVALVNDVFSITKPIMQINNIDLLLKFDETQNFTLFTNPNYVKQILLNLISNAKDAINEGGKNGEIMVNLSQNGSEIKLSVSDSGKGINQKVADKIFKDIVTTKKDGTGNGLSICALLTKRLNADIYLKKASDPTTFELALKRRDDE